jgi:hypothetical protein
VTNGSLTAADLAASARGARAYALVIASTCTPGCTLGAKRGVTSARRISTGVSCVRAPGIDSRQSVAAVTVEWTGTSNPEGNASAMFLQTHSPLGIGCARDTDFVIITERQAQTDVRDAAGTGTTSVAGNADFANDVEFVIAIP